MVDLPLASSTCTLFFLKHTLLLVEPLVHDPLEGSQCCGWQSNAPEEFFELASDRSETDLSSSEVGGWQRFLKSATNTPKRDVRASKLLRELTKTPYLWEISWARKTQISGSKLRTPVTPMQALMMLKLTKWYLRWFFERLITSSRLLIAANTAIDVKVSSWRILDEFSTQTNVEHNSATKNRCSILSILRIVWLDWRNVFRASSQFCSAELIYMI